MFKAIISIIITICIVTVSGLLIWYVIGRQNDVIIGPGLGHHGDYVQFDSEGHFKGILVIK